MTYQNLPALGGGMGLRHEHLDAFLQDKPAVRWLEVISENFAGFGGRVSEVLQEIARDHIIVGHGVCLSIGSTDELDRKHCARLRKFLDQVKSPWASDHLCFTMIDHTNLNDLIPLPFTEEALKNCVERIKIIQELLGRPFLVENVTRYMTIDDREMTEAEFISRVIEEADCGLLLDLTNVHLNASFHGYDAKQFIRSLPLQRVGQVHLSGWQPLTDGSIIDSHDAPVPEVIWDLFADLVRLNGPCSALVEWDNQLPPLARLVAEAQQVDSLLNCCCAS